MAERRARALALEHAGALALVNELHKALVPPRGLIASGKFEQYKRDIPYATLAQAFRSLVRPILGESETQLVRWRKPLSEALGPNGQLIVNLVPELELVIGKQPPVADLPPQDAKNRFELVFRRFLGAFARREHPLALFLDDLQWLDAAMPPSAFTPVATKCCSMIHSGMLSAPLPLGSMPGSMWTGMPHGFAGSVGKLKGRCAKRWMPSARFSLRDGRLALDR